MKKIIISAVAQNDVIGFNGKMPWHSKEEFQHFKKTTLGYPVIMGRKTFESLGKPLKNRLNIILTSRNSKHFADSELEVKRSLDEALEFCDSQHYEKVFIIGGAKVYKESLKIADQLVISYMKISPEGDTFFPKIDEKIWKIDKIINHQEFDVYYYSRS